jgi:AraC family transcriptional regulator
LARTSSWLILKLRLVQIGTVIFHPEDEVHTDHFFKDEGHVFSIEVARNRLEWVRKKSPALNGPADFAGGSLAWLVKRIYREFHHPDIFSPLVVEGLVLEAIADASRRSRSFSESKAPDWLERAREFVQATFSESMTLAAIAKEVGVHPVHPEIILCFCRRQVQDGPTKGQSTCVGLPFGFQKKYREIP